MEAQQKTVRLDLISVSSTNNIFRGKKDFSPAALQELTSSIAKDDVIQPILITPDPERPGFYKLIAGERRFHASKLAGKLDIPANIKEVLNDAKAFELQMIENDQRKDVHPMNQARGYKIMLDNDPTMTTADLALRIHRSETFVIQRLKLNDLVAEAKKDFIANKMLLGHALILARLTPQNQRDAIQNNTDNEGMYGTVAELENYINRNITNLLSNAPFDKNDPTLLPKAGACSLCPKRSGASPLLFADIKESDRCMDRSCFAVKCSKFLIKRTQEIVESEPEIVFLTNHNDPIPEVAQILEDHKVKPLKEYNDFNDYDKEGRKVKGFWISGRNEGKTVTIRLKNESKTNAGIPGNENLKSMIGRIQDRTKRARELDAEKVYAKILDSLKAHPTLKKGNAKKIMTEEEAFLWYIIIDKSGYHTKQELNKLLALNRKTPEKIFSTLKNLTPELKATILRKHMMDQYSGVYPQSDYGFMIRKIAEAHKDVDIKGFEAEQKEIQVKRESRAKERIQALVKEHKSMKKSDKK